MKAKGIVLLALLSILALGASAQQRFNGQVVLKADGGVLVSERGYSVRIGGEYIFKKTAHYIDASIQFMGTKQDLPTPEDLNVNNYNLLVNYGYTLFITSPIRLSLLGGILLGYQDVQLDRLPVGIDVKARSRFCYGVNLGVQGEVVLTRRISLYLEPLLQYNIASNFNNFIFGVNGGAKFYF